MEVSEVLDDGNLYDGIEAVSRKMNIEKSIQDAKIFKEENSKLRQELQTLNEQVRLLIMEKSVLEKNISSLYETALLEMTRKDKVIQSLEQEISELRKCK